MKTKSKFQLECENYMRGEMNYLGIRKDKNTGYVTGVPEKKSLKERILKFLNPSR